MKTPLQRQIVGVALAACAATVLAFGYMEKSQPTARNSGIVIFYRGLGLTGDSWLGRRVHRIEVDAPLQRMEIFRYGEKWCAVVYRPDGSVSQMGEFPRSAHSKAGLRVPDMSILSWAYSYNANGEITGEIIEGRGHLVSDLPRGTTRLTYSDGRVFSRSEELAK